MPQIPRREIRIPVKGHIVYSVGFATQGGTVKDISMHGCLVESDRPPHPASMLSCRMLLPGMKEPVEVQLALVQWVLGNHFGLKIVEMSTDTQKRLRRFLEDNYVQLARARRGRHGPEPDSSAHAPSVMVSPSSAGMPLEGSLALPDSEPSAATDCLQEPVAILPQDLSAFVGWILDARHAFEEKTPLPPPPFLEFQEFRACTQFIQSLFEQSETARSRQAEFLPRAHSQHEVIAHLLYQLKTGHRTLPGMLSPSADIPQEGEVRSADGEQPGRVVAQDERRVHERRSAPRGNKPRSLPLSVRLARLTAKLKLPFWPDPRLD